jgi:hypothetical protein
MEDVITHLSNSGELGIHYINYDYGYTISAKQPFQLSPDELALIDKDTIIGTKSIGGFFRDKTYSRRPISDIGIFWGFDEDSKLIEVSVWKP